MSHFYAEHNGAQFHTGCTICAIISTTCCSYVDQSGRIKRDLADIWKQTQILHKVAFRNNTWTIFSAPLPHGYQMGPG